MGRSKRRQLAAAAPWERGDAAASTSTGSDSPKITSVAGTALENLPSVFVGRTNKQQLAGLFSTHTIFAYDTSDMGILTQDGVIVALSGAALGCGLMPGMTIVSVNGVKLAAEVLDEAIAGAWGLYPELKLQAFTPAASLLPILQAGGAL